MTASDTETAERQVSGWLAEGHATWGCPIHGQWAEFQVHGAGAHPLAEMLERHLPAAVKL